MEDFDFDNILIDKKTNEHILIHNISYITLLAAKPLHIRFNKTDGFIAVYDERRYSVLFSLKI